jgi:hypothetical protein
MVAVGVVRVVVWGGATSVELDTSAASVGFVLAVDEVAVVVVVVVLVVVAGVVVVVDGEFVLTVVVVVEDVVVVRVLVVVHAGCTRV